MGILAAGFPPDDGTLAKYVKQEYEVYICDVSTGDKGHYKIMPEQDLLLKK